MKCKEQSKPQKNSLNLSGNQETSHRGEKQLFAALEGRSSSGLSLELPHQLLFTSLIFAYPNVSTCHLYSTIKEMIDLCFNQLTCLQSNICFKAWIWHDCSEHDLQVAVDVFVTCSGYTRLSGNVWFLKSLVAIVLYPTQKQAKQAVSSLPVSLSADCSCTWSVW